MHRTKEKQATASGIHENTASPPVVALGASAGGLDPLLEFFRHMPGDTGMVFMVIQHLSSQSKSMLGDILQKHTPMKVATVEDRMTVEPDHVYLNPADKHVALIKGVFHLSDPIRIPGTSFPIDHFFRSLADNLSERAICIILSGTGTDGSLGLKAVKETGGMAIVQEPQQAKFDGMPQNAISTAHVDHILPVERMAQEVMSYAKQPYLKVQKQHEPEDKNLARLMQKILLLIRSVTGSDFTQYKQSTIHRRVKRRMALHKIEAITDYHRYLQENTTEVHYLFKELLILVTSFFRDPAVFGVLAEKVIPDILARNDEGQPVRVWVPGCATGEEAVSLAVLFAEAGERLKMQPLNLQIFATDIDPEAIQRARAAEYPEAIGAEVSKERLRRFFIKKDHSYKLKSEIRDMIIFAVQDIVTNPPFSRLHLVSCRNLLIYLDPVLQGRMLTLFHYALNPDGYLLLGTSESIGTHSDLFAPVHIKSKIFRAKKVLSRRMAVNLPVGDFADASPGDRARSVCEAMGVFKDKPATGAALNGKKRRIGKEQPDDPRISGVEQELRDTRENLQATIEQLEGANEELKSMNEELQSTNEELQSMNEEMMTARGEQQSANEELATINAELRSRVNELTEVHDDITNLIPADVGRSIMDAIRDPLLVLDSDFKVVAANRSFCRRFQTTREETEHLSIYDLGNGRWNIPRLKELLEKFIDENTAFEDFEVEPDIAPGGPVKLILNARRMPGGDDRPERVLLAVEDATR